MLDEPTRPDETTSPQGSATPGEPPEAPGGTGDPRPGPGDGGTLDPIPTLQPVVPVGRRAAVVPLVAAAALGAVAVVAVVLATGGFGRGPGAAAATGAFAADGPTAGIPGAPLTIEIWADYQCPYCGLFTHGLEGTLLREFAATGRATLHFRDFAFLGQESVDAAVAARCAGKQGAYWPYHDLLYASQQGENQGAFAQPNLVRLAEFAGLDTGSFAACLADPTLAGEVATETATGRGLGISSTPTIRIVGPLAERTFQGLTPLRVLLDAIAAVEAGTSATDGTSGVPGSGSSVGPDGGSASPAP